MRKHYPLNSAGVEDAGQMPWSDGVPQTGTQGSFPGHAIVTDAEAEVLNAQALANLTQSGTDLTQLAQAMSRGIFFGGFTGSANALTAALPNNVSIPTLLVGMRFSGIVTTPNSGSVTVAIAGFGTSPGTLSLLRGDGQPLTSGDLPQNRPFDIRYDGSAFRMTAPVASEISSTASTTTIINNRSIVGGRYQPFTTVGAWSLTLPSDVMVFRARIWAPGGGGGGANGTAAGGSGGGGGDYEEGVYSCPAGATLSGVIGAPGTGGAAGGSDGTSGGATTLLVNGSAVITALGGGGGKGSTSGGVNVAGAGGTGTGGLKQRPGYNGGFAYFVSDGTTTRGIGGAGGSAYTASGTPPNLAAPGNTGSTPGGGGSGATANAAGGNGGAALIEIEY